MMKDAPMKTRAEMKAVDVPVKMNQKVVWEEAREEMIKVIL
jgi:hypothetical protein